MLTGNDKCGNLDKLSDDKEFWKKTAKNNCKKLLTSDRRCGNLLKLLREIQQGAAQNLDN